MQQKMRQKVIVLYVLIDSDSVAARRSLLISVLRFFMT